MLDNLKRVFLFIGMVIGAGFATGKEVVVYFANKSIFTIIFAGVLMGIFYAIFLIIGRSSIYQYMKNTRIGKVMTSLMYMSVMASFVVMTTGAEELLEDVVGIKFLGIMLSIVAIIVADMGMKYVKNINLIIVPIIIVMMIWITKGERSKIVGELDMFASFRYVGLNMLVAGYLMLEEGEKVSNCDILISSSIVSVVFAILLYLLVTSVMLYQKTSMPLYILAISKGYKYIFSLEITLSIFSTMIGDVKLIFDGTYTIVRYKIITIIFMAFLSFISYFVSFDKSVNIVYKIEGIIGVVFIIYVVATYIIFSIRNRKSNTFVHYDKN